jgi:hypothetical protein
METLKINTEKNQHNGLWKSISLFLLFMVLFTVEAMADVNLEEEKAKAARTEFYSYLFMGIGFALVIAIAIFTSIKKKTPGSTGGEHKPIHHHPINHRHDHAHGRRGTNLSRR